PSCYSCRLVMKIFAAILASILLASVVLAGPPPKSRDEVQALIASLNFRQGNVVLHDGLATLNVPEGFRYLNGPDANKIIVDLWGNPPGEKPLGLLMPDVTPITE